MTEYVAICCYGGCNITADSFSKEGGNNVDTVRSIARVSLNGDGRSILYRDEHNDAYQKGLSNVYDPIPSTETCEELVHRAVTALLNEYDAVVCKETIPGPINNRIRILGTEYARLCVAEARDRKVT